MKRITLGTLGFVAITFLVQALSHFVVNVNHYAGIGFLRSEPVMVLGILTMIIQGFILSYLYPFYRPSGYNPILRGWTYGMLLGLFLVSYIALVEPSKYNSPSIPNWIMVEGLAGLVQFSLFGIILGALNRSHHQRQHE